MRVVDQRFPGSACERVGELTTASIGATFPLLQGVGSVGPEETDRRCRFIGCKVRASIPAVHGRGNRCGASHGYGSK